MTHELNILARRIFNRLDKDISARRGIGGEWDQISPNTKNVDIRNKWEQIITEEVTRMLRDADKESSIQALFDEIGIKMKP